MISRTGPQALLFTDPVRYFHETYCQGYDEGYAKGFRDGYAKGMAKAILIVLEARGVAMSPKLRERVLESTDVATLERWLRRAVTATSEEQLFP
jgi:hypothetical protein